MFFCTVGSLKSGPNGIGHDPAVTMWGASRSNPYRTKIGVGALTIKYSTPPWRSVPFATVAEVVASTIEQAVAPGCVQNPLKLSACLNTTGCDFSTSWEY